jgi:hypothetical protein
MGSADENIKWREFNNEISDLRSLKLNVKCEETLFTYLNLFNDTLQ